MVQVRTQVTLEESPQDVKKVVIAVHGIGEQLSFATVQSVVKCFCEYFGEPAGVPLGMLSGAGKGRAGQTPPVASQYAFGEVYWAHVPRSAVDDKHTLEEATAWAKTLVARLQCRLRTLQRSRHASPEAGTQSHMDQITESDLQLAGEILSEVIEAVTVLDRICFIAEKAGLFTFDLKQLLDNFLGDVQIVTEFRRYREQVLEAFALTLQAAHEDYPDAEIHIVAHSEGTVVSLLGLMRAFENEEPPAWANRVRGFMTIGSPIDKHLMLWPELFESSAPAVMPDEKIRWYNYYDRGDPVGYELDRARKWIDGSGWRHVFDFSAENDYGFSRYPLPGKAHVDYWTDPRVFGHFIREVVRAQPPAPSGECRRSLPCERSKSASGAPALNPRENSLRAQLIAYVLPYVMVFGIICASSFVFVKAALGVIFGSDDAANMGITDVAGRVLPLAVALMGLTIISRVPRLTRNDAMQFVAWLLAGTGALIFVSVLGGIDTAKFAIGPWQVTAKGLIASMAAIVVVVVYLAARLAPCSGVKPLLIGGVGAALLYILLRVTLAEQPAADVTILRPFWPLVLATALLLYGWWLAVLLFDLSFVWHWYMRNDRVRKAAHTSGDASPGTRGEPPIPPRPFGSERRRQAVYETPAIATTRPTVQAGQHYQQQ